MGRAAQGIDVDDGALPGLECIGFVRSVRTPQFDGITFHEVLCKSALNKIPNAAAVLPFQYTVNGYDGVLSALPCEGLAEVWFTERVALVGVTGLVADGEPVLPLLRRAVGP